MFNSNHLIGFGATDGGLQIPVSLGSATSSVGVVSSFAMTTIANILAGDLVVLAVSCATGAASFPASISDGTNSYTLVGSIQTSTFFNNSLWYKENAAAVASGATITVTLNTPTTGSGNGLGVIAARSVTIATASSLDKNAGNVTTSATSITATTAALAQLNEIAFGTSWSDAGGAPTYSGASGFTNLVNVTIPGGNGLLILDYKIPNSAAAISFIPTWSASGRVLGEVATFKER